jgi:hypothetical protein
MRRKHHTLEERRHRGRYRFHYKRRDEIRIFVQFSATSPEVSIDSPFACSSSEVKADVCSQEADRQTPDPVDRRRRRAHRSETRRQRHRPRRLPERPFALTAATTPDSIHTTASAQRGELKTDVN